MVATPPEISIEYNDGERTVRVGRSSSVPDAFWIKVQSEWGTEGRRPADYILAPVVVFLRRIQWLPNYCRRFGVRVDWRGNSRELIDRQKRDRVALKGVLEHPNPIDVGLIDQEIAGSRFKRELKDFQKRDASKLLALDHGANFSVPGTGKTTVAYATYEALRTRGTVEQLLVVAPLSAFEAWEEEASACLSPTPLLGVFGTDSHDVSEVLLVNYQRLEGGMDELLRWAGRAPTMIVLDEAHRMKRGWTGQWGRNCLQLAQVATRRDILTGTPAPQSADDLEALFDFVWPGQVSVLLPREHRAQKLNQISATIAPLFSRTNKSELGLTPPTIQIIPVDLGPVQEQIYSALKGQIITHFQLSNHSRRDLRRLGSVVMYLLEAASNPPLLVAGSHKYDPIQFRHPPLELSEELEIAELLADYPKYEEPPKYSVLRSLIEQNVSKGRKTLVWSNFVRTLETLHKRTLVNYEPALVHGGITETRRDEIERFRNDDECHVLLANPASIGEGISLHQSCHDAVYFDRTFNAGQYLQSVDRIHRLGLDPKQATRIHILSTSHTIDEVVDRRVEDKAIGLGQLLRDPDLAVMSLPQLDEQDVDFSSPLSGAVDDVDAAALFEHLDS